MSTNYSLSHVLQQDELMTTEQLQKAIIAAQQHQQPLLAYLITEHKLNPTTIAKACSKSFALPYRDLNPIEIDQTLDIPNLLTLLKQYALLPLTKCQDSLTVAISDPDLFYLAEELTFHCQQHINIIFTPYDQLITYINRQLNYIIYSHFHSHHQHTNFAISELVTQIIHDAICRRASDIHAECMPTHYRIRLRIDGLLTEACHLDTHYTQAIVSHIKIKATMDIAEKRLPQDGRFTIYHPLQGQRDCRVSTCPTILGEKIVIRLLQSKQQLLNLNQLGMNQSQQNLFRHMIHKPQGLILVTGPTGSGKSLTLYTALQLLNKKTSNIASAENPVEIQLAGINQININEKIGLDFSCALRTFLRQDPDILMVGEIRDSETAHIAIRAAQTGHLVLATLHTNSAAQTITRLVDMGIPTYHLANSLSLIVAQRLVRLLCPHCKLPNEAEISPLPVSNQPTIKAHYSAGSCELCIQGYRGRIAIYEMMTINNELRLAISQRHCGLEIQKLAATAGMQTLAESAQSVLNKGLTSVTEINRVLL